ncbi:hypothetical protein Q8G35_01205 [Peribacillus simplex]|uniref:SH3 domain-containing protein n=2 Tax=Peribacillus TaxID=2675229 RepID=A0AA90NYQ1_9BACI|nr:MULTISPECIES: hypothetical protein [Peribacillus]MDP1417022.1 hypothetical protein [Peribacillus simplex]MDP1449677.1 hypothetical protein [Peribacillus frigoritolerans]
MKRLMMAALLARLIIQTTNLVKAETKTSCETTPFKIVMKSAADVKEKASSSSKTLKTYKKSKELSASGRTGNWYKVCQSKKTAYINMADVKEVFSTDEKALLKKSIPLVSSHKFESWYGLWKRNEAGRNENE